MIQKLRIKFICVIMAIVMLMMGIILGVVIHFTSRSMEIQSINMMRSIAGRPYYHENLGKHDDNVRLPFFTVQLGHQGQLLGTSGGYFDLSDQDYVLEVINAALASKLTTGELKEYDLRFLKDKSPVGYTIVFADTATEAATLRSMILNCLLILALSSIPFWGISFLLSRWVIRPVAAAWEQQRQFVADASHELKTPLSVIMANAELMQNDDSTDEDRRTYSSSILAMTYQMRTLVENMLEMAKIDNGTQNMKYTAVDFSQLVSDAVLSFQLLYEEKQLGLCCETQEGIYLHGSEHHLYQVLDVLLDNALKYTCPNGTVFVKLTHSGRNCILSVSSPGAPISNEDLRNIFKRFYRSDKARAMNGSYGLGLSIAESIVTAHKGKIWAASKDGINSFYVQIPVSDSAVKNV